MNYRLITECDLGQKRVLVRADLNAPIEGDNVSNDARLRAFLPTLRYALEQNAAVLIVSHLGRPTAGQFEAKYSLAPVAKRLSELLGQNVPLISEWLNGVDIQPGQCALAENVRFLPGETENDDKLAKQLASLADVFVMDAFGCAHRRHASSYGVANYINVACAGLLLDQEVTSLQRALANPEPPVLAILGGSKLSTKLQLIEAMLDKVDSIILGGGIANTFLAAQGYLVGKSLVQHDFINTAQQLMARAQQKNVKLLLPEDVIVAPAINSQQGEPKALDDINEDDAIFDVGSKTAAQYQHAAASANTIIWNGPVGVFENPAFAEGTQQLADAIANNHGFSLAGGGDTVAAIEQFNISESISYISTGGGAFLEYMEAGSLPGIDILKEHSHAKAMSN